MSERLTWMQLVQVTKRRTCVWYLVMYFWLSSSDYALEKKLLRNVVELHAFINERYCKQKSLHFFLYRLTVYNFFYVLEKLNLVAEQQWVWNPLCQCSAMRGYHSIRRSNCFTTIHSMIQFVIELKSLKGAYLTEQRRSVACNHCNLLFLQASNITIFSYHDEGRYCYTDCYNSSTIVTLTPTSHRAVYDAVIHVHENESSLFSKARLV